MIEVCYENMKKIEVFLWEYEEIEVFLLKDRENRRVFQPPPPTTTCVCKWGGGGGGAAPPPPKNSRNKDSEEWAQALGIWLPVVFFLIVTHFPHFLSSPYSLFFLGLRCLPYSFSKSLSS